MWPERDNWHNVNVGWKCWVGEEWTPYVSGICVLSVACALPCESVKAGSKKITIVLQDESNISCPPSPTLFLVGARNSRAVKPLNCSAFAPVLGIPQALWPLLPSQLSSTSAKNRLAVIQPTYPSSKHLQISVHLLRRWKYSMYACYAFPLMLWLLRAGRNLWHTDGFPNLRQSHLLAFGPLTCTHVTLIHTTQRNGIKTFVMSLKCHFYIANEKSGNS